MKETSISNLLKNMSDENNYADDIWKICLDEKGKRYDRKVISSLLKKLELLGFIKKIKISSTETYYNKVHYTNPEDYVGFVNNIIFTNESKIKGSLKKIENKNIFVEISKDLNSVKVGKYCKIDFEKILDVFLNLAELSSAISLVRETSKSEKLKKQLSICHDEIKETMENINNKMIINRNSNEIIVIQRRLANRMPSVGCLKL